MRARLGPESDGVGIALAIHLSIYGLVFALFSVWVYGVLLRPKELPNPGLAAYQAPPGTVISYQLPARLLAQQGQPPPLAEVPPAPEADETTGRSTGIAERVPEPKPDPKVAKAKKSKPAKVAAGSRGRGDPSSAHVAAYSWYGGNRPY